MEFNH